MYSPFNFHWPADFLTWRYPGYGEMWRRIGKEFGDHVAAKGWKKTKWEIFFNQKKRYRLYPFDGDETRFMPDEEIFETYYDMAVREMVARRDMQFIYRTDSSWAAGIHSKSHIAKLFDLWVINAGIGGWFPDGMRNLIKLGHDVFFYGGAPRLTDSLLDLPGWMLMIWMRGAHGFTPWLCTGAGRNPLADGPTNNGATALYYPGHEVGLDEPLVTLRTKVMRLAMQTGEYLYNMAKRDSGDRKRSQQLVNRTLKTNSRNWWGPGAPAFAKEKLPHLWDDQDWSVAGRQSMLKGFEPLAFEKLRVKVGDTLAAKK
jgi:hypothetical protein